MTCNVSEKANSLVTSLKGDTTPTLPTVDLSASKFNFDPSSDATGLYSDVPSVSLADLTTVALEGTGVFDKLMKAASLHIAEEYDNNRLTGDEYAKVYTSMMESVLSNSTRFVLDRERARWESVTAQMNARSAQADTFTSLVSLERMKLDTAKVYYDMENSGAQMSLTKVQVANANQENCMLQFSTDREQFTVEKIMPAQLAQEVHKAKCLLPTQTKLVQEQYESERANTQDLRSDEMTPHSGTVALQRSILEIDKNTKTYTLDAMLPIQRELTLEQVESERAKTLGTRTDGTTPITGIMGTQIRSGDAEAAIQEYQLTNTLPAQLSVIQEQHEAERAKTLGTRTDGTTPIAGVMGSQVASANADTLNKAYALANTLPAQLLLLQEQRESERAKTLDTRVDGSTVVSGSMGKQKELLDQQIDSFQKDAKHKVAKMYLDSWITQKTLDEGLIAPTEFQNAAIDSVLSQVRTANGYT